MKASTTLLAPALLILALLTPLPAAAGPWRAAENNSYGWQLMTPAERVDHQRRLRSFESYDECRAYQDEHHAQMAERARRHGIVLTPRAQSACEQLQARGRFR